MSHASYRIISATSLHPALRSQRHGIPRILQQERVVKTIARVLSSLNAKPTILAFATVCKALERPILDVLWETQDDWFQLLKCFSPDIWEDRDNAFVSCCSLTIARQQPRFMPFGIFTLAFPPQSCPGRVDSFQTIRFKDGPHEHHDAAEIYIDTLLSNLEHGSQQLPVVPETANIELENRMGLRPLQFLIPLTQSIVCDDLLRR